MFFFAVSASADTELTEEMKQEGEGTKGCGEKENDQQKANVQSEKDHPLLDLVPITPPFDLLRFACHIFLSLDVHLVPLFTHLNNLIILSQFFAAETPKFLNCKASKTF
jgi:hypothetical protein